MFSEVERVFPGDRGLICKWRDVLKMEWRVRQSGALEGDPVVSLVPRSTDRLQADMPPACRWSRSQLAGRSQSV